MFEGLATRVQQAPCEASAANEPIQHTRQPIVTGTSIIAVKYAGGCLMAGDTLGSYGSLARFKDNVRITSIGSTLVGGDGDFSDFQEIKKYLEDMETEEKTIDDGITYDSNEIAHRLTTLLYQKRSKMNPYWNNLVIAGVLKNGTSYLYTTDKIGTSYEADYVATGFGLHLATPILYDRWKPNMSYEDALKLVEDCLRVCYYRDCRTINRISFAQASAGRCVIEEPRKLETKWDYKLFVSPP